MRVDYPAGTVAALIASEHVSAPTRAALTERLAAAAAPPRFFAAAAFAVLAAVCARLVPPGSRARVDVAGAIDARLADGRGNGWRYAVLPTDGDAYRHGLGVVERVAQARFAAGFAALGGDRQDEVLTAVRRDAPRFFEELLAETVEAFYAHPLAQEEIGYAGMADLPGWTRLGLDARDAREPEPPGG